MTIASEEEARAFVAQFAHGSSAAEAMERLDRLASLLVAENEQQNLIARATISAIWQRHIADSVQLLTHVPRETLAVLDEGDVWLDLGTGAGFPGLVIAALRPAWNVRLVESRRKRVEWLARVIIELQLGQCSVAGQKLELVESFAAAVISARAFAPMPRLLDLSARFSTNDTFWLLPKGRSAAQDLAALPESKRALFHVEQSRTDSEAGIVVGRLEQKAPKTR